MIVGGRGSGAAGRFLLCALVLCAGGSLVAQESPPRWSVAAGTGFVFRRIDSGSFGASFRAARVIPVVRGLYLEPGVSWYGFLSSDAWINGGDDGLCPELCVHIPRRDGIGLLGLEVGASYLKPDASNRLHPVVGFGVYRSTARSTPTTRVGATVGVAFPFRGSLRGPVLDARYFRLFNDRRFTSAVTFSLRWIL